MSNEMRLLKAFIEASGYRIETTMVYNQDHNKNHPEVYSHSEYKVTKKPRVRVRAKKEVLEECMPDFDIDWNNYPKRAGSNPKSKAYDQWFARLMDGENTDYMYLGTLRYKAFCDATGKTGTEYVMQAAKFFGKDKHYLESWSLPKGHSKLSLPKDDNKLTEFAKKNGLSSPAPGKQMWEYRQKLESELASKGE